MGTKKHPIFNKSIVTENTFRRYMALGLDIESAWFIITQLVMAQLVTARYTNGLEGKLGSARY
jgi:hypothetical protein